MSRGDAQARVLLCRDEGLRKIGFAEGFVNHFLPFLDELVVVNGVVAIDQIAL